MNRVLIATLYISSIFVSSVVSYETHELQSLLFNWIRSNGGYINEKLEFSTGSNPDWTIRGIFTKEDIANNEVLFEIPHHLELCHVDNCHLFHNRRD